jgi:hypothetical protein
MIRNLRARAFSLTLKLKFPGRLDTPGMLQTKGLVTL